MEPKTDKAAAKEAATKAKAEAKAVADQKKADAKAKDAAKKAAAKEKADAKKAKDAEKKAAAKAKADEKKAAAKAKKEAAKKPRIDVAELKVRLKEANVEGYRSNLGEKALIELATKHEIEVPTKAAGSGIIPESYRKKYGKSQSCGDEIAKAMKDATTVTSKGGKDGKKTITTVDPAKLAAVANANNIDIGRWKTHNIGMQRMNLSNVLRGMHNRGEKIKIGTKTFKGEKEGTGAAL